MLKHDLWDLTLTLTYDLVIHSQPDLGQGHKRHKWTERCYQVHNLPASLTYAVYNHPMFSNFQCVSVYVGKLRTGEGQVGYYWQGIKYFWQLADAIGIQRVTHYLILENFVTFWIIIVYEWNAMLPFLFHNFSIINLLSTIIHASLFRRVYLQLASSLILGWKMSSKSVRLILIIFMLCIFLLQTLWLRYCNF